MSTDFDTLLLLIGTNPIPNFVVAEYFLKTNINLKKIVLIFSEDTKHQRGTGEYAEKIKHRLLLRNPNRSVEFLKIPLSDIGSSRAIVTDLKSRLSPLLKSSNSIHLNYTGGTKSMGIHVYEFLQRDFKNSKTFSYLDARKFRLIYDETERTSDDLRERVKLDVDEIIDLHGFEKLTTKALSTNDFEEAIELFGKLIEQNKLTDYLNSYSGELFRENDNLIEKARKLAEKLGHYKAHGPFLEIDQKLPDSLRLFNPDGSLRQDLTNQGVKTSVKFFDGVWLELYVLKILKKLSQTHSFKVEHDIVLRKKDWPAGTNFQLDLVLVKGYQLVGISCTTSNQKSICKNKGFEIFLRSRQIGGDESRAILITRLNEKAHLQLEEELQVDTGGSKNILVLGESDLREEKLTQKILDVFG